MDHRFLVTVTVQTEDSADSGAVSDEAELVVGVVVGEVLHQGSDEVHLGLEVLPAHRVGGVNDEAYVLLGRAV